MMTRSPDITPTSSLTGSLEAKVEFLEVWSESDCRENSSQEDEKV